MTGSGKTGESDLGLRPFKIIYSKLINENDIEKIKNMYGMFISK